MLKRILSASSAVITIVLLSLAALPGCGSVGGPPAMPPGDPESTTTAPDPDTETRDQDTAADAKDPGEKPGGEVVMVSPELTKLEADASVEENIARVRELVLKFKTVYGRPDYPPGDPRRQTDPVFRDMNTARRELIDLYNGAELSGGDHLALCNALSELRGDGDDFQQATVEHCSAYLDATEEDSESLDFLKALSILGQSHYVLGDLEGAERDLDRFLSLACDQSIASPVTKIDRHRAAFCKRILTYYLPEIYHRTGNVGGLRELIAEGARRGYTASRDLFKIRQYLIDGLWQGDDLEPLEQMVNEIVAMPLWAGRSDPTRDLLPLALSSKARLKLLADDFYGIRQVYMDYEWNQPGVNALWRQRHLAGATESLCMPAPVIEVSYWLLERKPAFLPGSEATLPRPLMLIFFKPGIAVLDTIAGVNKLARQHADNLAIIGVLPVTQQVYNVTTKRTLSSLDAAAFRKAAAEFVTGLEIPYPVGVLGGGDRDPVASRYHLNSYPTLVLIDRRNRVVGYHTAPLVDAGWSRCIEKLAKD